MTVAAYAVLLVLPFCLATAAITDLITMTIPNRVSAALIVAFFVLAPLIGLDLHAIAMSVAAALIVFAICFALFALNVMGGGDAKLLTATALWFGLGMPLAAFLVTVAYVGGGVTLLFLLLRSQSHHVMAAGIRLPASLVSAKKIPYGIAIAIGGFLTFPQSPIATLAMRVLM